MIATERPTLSLAELDAFDPHPSGAGAEKRFCCPLPACREKPVDRAHQSLNVNVESGLWLCQRCHARGKLLERWRDRPLFSGREAQRRAALRAFTLPAPAPEKTAASTPLLAPMLGACVPLAHTPGAVYLRSRGACPAFAADAGAVFSADWWGRPAVVFPLRDLEGRVVAANARYVDGREDPKTRTCGDRKLGVFATPGALEGDTLTIVEGPLDALALAEADVSAIALVTTNGPRWLRQAAAFKRVLLALDADKEGDAGAEALLAELAPFARSVERLRPPAPKDWNDSLLQLGYGGLCEWLEERCR